MPQRPELLDKTAIDSWLADHADWQRDGDEIRRTIECASFPAAIDLVVRVGEAAEAADHHPDIDIRWRTVHFALSTHSVGGLTQNDLDLATIIDKLVR